MYQQMLKYTSADTFHMYTFHKEGEILPQLKLGYKGWNDSSGKDESFVIDDTTHYSDTMDAYMFLCQWFGYDGYDGYFPYGERVSPPIDLSNVGIVADSKIYWTTTIPAGTSLFVDVSIDGENWTNVPVSGQSIPVLYVGQDVTDKTLFLKQRFYTKNNQVSPSLSSLTVEITPAISIINNGDINANVEVWIEKIGDGDISLIHMTNGNRTTTFTGLVDGETIYINSDTQDIATDINGVYRYDNFNDIYPELHVGNNIYKINGDSKLVFRYQTKFLQG